jgi:acyl-CoA reductase-like NAD-dependent aldehyde dehydrogenase
MKEYKIYYEGQWQESDAEEYIDVENPTTEEKIATIPNGTESDVDKAVQSAKKAFPAWNETAPEKRAEYVQQILDGIREREQEFADAIVEELGASQKFSEDGQLPLSLNEMEAYLEEFEKMEFEEETEGSTVVKEGFGVIAASTPWNYPLNQIQRKLTPALLAGNTLVIKPAELTPISAMILTEIIDNTDLPKGVFNLVTGDGENTGDYLTRHEDVDVISFTGSTDVGSKMYENAAPHIKKLILELGGKSPMVYLEGGDLELAVEKAAGTCLNNSGQSCSALTRLLVPEDQLEEAKEVIKSHYEDIKVGDPSESDTTVGPLVSAEQKETVMNYIEKGKEEGAEVLVGGNEIDRTGHFVEPTVFVNVTNDMTIAQEEIFGPVLVVITYKDVDEAIEIANDSIYGLSGAVVGPEEEANKVARKLRTGNIMVNDASRSPEAQFGGYKQSGLGCEVGIYGIEDYLETKAIFNA